jgi:hypothetical protein
MSRYIMLVRHLFLSLEILKRTILAPTFKGNHPFLSRPLSGFKPTLQHLDLLCLMRLNIAASLASPLLTISQMRNRIAASSVRKQPQHAWMMHELLLLHSSIPTISTYKSISWGVHGEGRPEKKRNEKVLVS